MPRGKGTKPRTVDKRFRPGFIADLDGRYPVVRGLKHRFACYLADLGGMENLSHMEQTVVKRIVHLEHLVEQKESSLIRGESVEVHTYLACVNSLSGLLSKLGLKRRARPISLSDYMRDKQGGPHGRQSSQLSDDAEKLPDPPAGQP